jgi:hypothetical protein
MLIARQVLQLAEDLCSRTKDINGHSELLSTDQVKVPSDILKATVGQITGLLERQ